MATALCLIILFMTGMFPFATYALPAMAGIVLIVVVQENGLKAALLVYVAVALLSVFVVPDREAALMFIAFFGYYPVIKPSLDRMRVKPLAYLIKLIIFNVAVIAAYFMIIYVFGIPDILEEFGDFGRYSALVLLGMGNVVFIVYEFALTNIISIYLNWFRPRLYKKAH